MKYVSHSAYRSGFLRHPAEEATARKGVINMPIVIAPANNPLKIVRIAADEKVKKHLESLGITVNGEITVLSSSGGSVVCKVKDGRIALDSELSTKIFVA